jgi:ribosomal protein S18 acetylase RimI-like enzyme
VSGVAVRPLAEGDRPWLSMFLEERWGALIAVGGGRVHQLEQLPGFVAVDGERRVGLLTYVVEGEDCEIVTIDAVEEGRGVGTALIDRLAQHAARSGCRRLHLITTNDNVRAIRFYQRRGFHLIAVRVNAVTESRRIKPSIPEVGMHGIPLRDELVLERLL